MDDTLANLLKMFREEVGLTQQRLAFISGVDPGTISRIETGANDNPGIQTIEALAKALGRPAADFLPTAPNKPAARTKPRLVGRDEATPRTVLDFLEHNPDLSEDEREYLMAANYHHGKAPTEADLWRMLRDRPK